MLRFQNKKILIGLCGGVAAYKACDLIRELERQGASCVQVLLTDGAKQFVSLLTLETLSGQPVLQNAFCNVGHKTPIHIWLAQNFDAFLIMPATANTIAKLAQGLADDLLSTTAITFTHKPIIIAPAMNCRMWENPLVVENTQKLRDLPHVTMIDPVIGDLACGEFGEGKLASQSTLLDSLYQVLHPNNQLFINKKILVTAGGTAEPIDSVRYITNKSSGKMGVAIADELFAMGASVELVHTLSDLPEKPYKTVLVKTVIEMQQAVESDFSQLDGVVMTAAVSDFKVKTEHQGKIKKQENYSIELVQTPDILKRLGELKQPHQFLIGFAAESGEITPEQLQRKLLGKNLDMLVCNDIARADIGFSAEQNEVTLYFKDKPNQQLSKASKPLIAQQLLVAFAQTVLNLVSAADSEQQFVSANGELDVLKEVHPQ